MFETRRYRDASRKRNPLWKALPWAFFVEPGVIATKWGGFQRTFEIRGPDMESSMPEQLVANAAAANFLLRDIGQDWGMYWETVSVEVTDYPGDDTPPEQRWQAWPDHASYLLDEERRQQFTTEGRHFEVRHYLTITYRTPRRSTAWFRSFLIQNDKKRAGVDYDHHLVEFTRRVDALASRLSDLMHVRPLTDGETLAYLHGTVSVRKQGVADPEAKALIDRNVGSDRYINGVYPTLGGKPMRVLEIDQWPRRSWPGIFEDLAKLGIRYRLMIRWLPYDKQDGEKAVMKAFSAWDSLRLTFGEMVYRAINRIPAEAPGGKTNDDAVRLAGDAAAARRDVLEGHVGVGRMTVTLVVFGADQDDLDEKERTVNRVLSRAELLFRQQIWNEEAWLGSLPGHPFANGCWSHCTTINLAHMAPLTAVWTGDRWCKHLNGPALLHTVTNGALPFFLNLHNGGDDTGHTKIIGPTGAGKSTLIDVLCSAWRRYEGARVIRFDYGRAATVLTRAMGGVIYELGAHDLGLQPFARIDEEGEFIASIEWTLDLLRAQNVSLNPSVKADVTQALRLLAANPRKARTMTHLQTYLHAPNLQEALAPYTHDGPYGYLLDADSESIEQADVLTFEMRQLFDKREVVVPVLTYIFRLLERSFDGRPTLLVLDEGWRYLLDTLFAAKINDWLRTMRKLNVTVIFATHTLSDLDVTAMAALSSDSCPNTLYLANDKAMEERNVHLYAACGLNMRQIEMLARMQRKKEVYFDSAYGKRRFEVRLGIIGKALCGRSSKPDLMLSDQLWLACQGDTSRFLKAWLHATLPPDWAEAAAGPLDDVPYSIAAE